MNKERIIDYLSLILVLSFLILHNIVLVISGILIAIYSTNKHKINSYIGTQNIIYINRKSICINQKNNIQDKSIDSEESLERLVQSVEELGFIPTSNITDIDKGV